jgi:hypothetical protein
MTLGEILLDQHRSLEALTEMEQEPAEIWRLIGEALAHRALARTVELNVALTHQGPPS